MFVVTTTLDNTQNVPGETETVRVIIKKDSGTQKKDSRRTPFLAK